MEAPAGRPPIATDTAPLNPFCPATDTVKLEPELPGAAVMLVGEMPMLKSAEELIVNVIGAEWLSEPELAVMVSGKFPVDAGTDSVTFRLVLTGALNGNAGDVVTPVGKPAITNVRAPANPFLPVVETVNVELEVPALAVTVAGDTATSKSWDPGFGGGVDPLLHPTSVDNERRTQTSTKAAISAGRRAQRHFTNYIHLSTRLLSPFKLEMGISDAKVIPSILYA